MRFVACDKVDRRYKVFLSGGQSKDQGKNRGQIGEELMPHHFAIVMLGIPTRGTSLTVIWNKR